MDLPFSSGLYLDGVGLRNTYCSGIGLDLFSQKFVVLAPFFFQGQRVELLPTVIGEAQFPSLKWNLRSWQLCSCPFLLVTSSFLLRWKVIQLKSVCVRLRSVRPPRADQKARGGLAIYCVTFSLAIRTVYYVDRILITPLMNCLCPLGELQFLLRLWGRPRHYGFPAARTINIPRFPISYNSEGVPLRGLVLVAKTNKMRGSSIMVDK